MVVFAGEKRLPAQHLRQDATDGPKIDGFGVLLERKHYLGRAVPAGGDIFNHEALLFLDTGSKAGEPEIADLQIVVRVQQQIGGIQIAV